MLLWFSVHNYCKLQILRILRILHFALRTAWDWRSFDAPKIVTIHFTVKSSSRNHRQRRVAKKKSREATAIPSVTSSRSMTIPVVSGPENRRRSARVRTRKWSKLRVKIPFEHSLSIWTIVDALGRETTRECLMTYERNVECHFRSQSAFIDVLARSFLRSLKHKSRFAPRSSSMRKM